MKEPEHIYWSPLPREEVARKISAQRPKWFSSGVRGSCREDKVVLCYEKFRLGRGHQPSEFSGTLAERDGGTLIKGRFRAPNFRSVLLRYAWLAAFWTLIGLFFSYGVWVKTGTLNPSGHPSPLLIWGLFMGLCLITLIIAYFTRHQDLPADKEDVEEIKFFLRTELDTKPMER